MLTIDVLISTCNERFEQAVDVLQAPQPGVRYIIVHQLFGPQKILPDGLVDKVRKRPDVTLIQSKTQGLSLSRNLALGAANSELVVFTDDDVRFTKDAFPNIRNQFYNYSDDFMVFRFEKKSGCSSTLAKVYPASGTRVSPLSAFRVSSVELVARRQALVDANVFFDQRFGLGSPLPGSEDNIFVSDCIAKGLLGRYSDCVILVHPEVSSGDTWTPATAKVRGALFKRVFGYKGILLLLPFLWRHRRRAAVNYPFTSMCRLALCTFFKFKP